MMLGSNLPPYPRCKLPLNQLPLSYDPTEQRWYHKKCWDEGHQQLANAHRLATALTGEIIPADPNWQGNPVFWQKDKPPTPPT